VTIIKILLVKVMSVDLTNTYRHITLIVSAKFGNMEATKSLVERGTPFDNIDKEGDTQIHLGARYGKFDIFCSFLNLYFKDTQCFTSLRSVGVAAACL